jgi:hypothetical protein
MNDDKEWYTVKELAATWGLKPSWIRDHSTRKQPRLPARKFGKFLLFHRDDLQKFIDEMRLDRVNEATRSKP